MADVINDARCLTLTVPQAYIYPLGSIRVRCPRNKSYNREMNEQQHWIPGYTAYVHPSGACTVSDDMKLSSK